MDTKDTIYVPLRCRNAFAHYISIMLARKRVQSYSDQELFWIISNGIRFTGMPGFGKTESPDHIWGLVNYVRTLPGRNQG